jgi:hypothetical protein
MTPQEIFEYKQKWMHQEHYTVEIDEDFEYEGKRWCRAHLKQHQWGFVRYTDMYSHTLCFESQDDQHKFVEFLKGR